MNDLEKRLSDLKSDLSTTWQKLQIDQKIAQLKLLEKQISEPELWQNPDHAKKINTSFSRLKSEVEPWQILEMQTNDLAEIIELQETDLIPEIDNQLTPWNNLFKNLKKHSASQTPWTKKVPSSESLPVSAVPKLWTGQEC